MQAQREIKPLLHLQYIYSVFIHLYLYIYSILLQYIYSEIRNQQIINSSILIINHIIIIQPTLSVIKKLRYTILSCFIFKSPYLNGYTKTLFTAANPFKSQEDFMLFK